MNDTEKALIRIVDDDRDFLDGLAFMLECKGWRTAAYENPRDFLRQDSPSVPGCLILDIRMPQMSGIELQAEMKKRGLSLPVIILTGHADVESAVRTLKTGAVDFLQKPVNADELFESIDAAVKLSFVKCLGGLDAKALEEVLRGFSMREKQVTAMLSEGLVNSAVAERLNLTMKTVQNYRNGIYGKLRVHNARELHDVLEQLDSELLDSLLQV